MKGTLSALLLLTVAIAVPHDAAASAAANIPPAPKGGTTEALREMIKKRDESSGRRLRDSHVRLEEGRGQDAGAEASDPGDNGIPSTGDGDATHDPAKAGDDSAVDESKCGPHCDASCCYFSQPKAECSGCGEDMLCRPGAECYETGNQAATTEAATKNAEGAICQGWCLETNNCCHFSHPKADCGGCDPATYGCAPGLECFETGLLGGKEDL